MILVILSALSIPVLAYLLLPSTVLIRIFERIVLTDNGIPQPATPLNEVNRLDAMMADHYFSDGSNRIYGRMFHNPKNKSRSVLLYCAGRLTDVGSAADAIEALLRAGHTVFAFDYPGVGRSSGKASFRGNLQAGLAAYDYVHHELNYHAKRICVYGVSLGGWTAAHITAHRDDINGALVLQSTGDDMIRIGKLQNALLRLWPSFLFTPRLNNIALVRNNHRRYFGMHGELDAWTYVNDKGLSRPGFPYQCGEILARACNSMARPKFFLLPNSTHQHVWATAPVLYQQVMLEVLQVINVSESTRYGSAAWSSFGSSPTRD